MSAVQFNFKIPKRYRREFYLILQSSRHHLLVDRNGVAHKRIGYDMFQESGLVFDWIQDSIMRVRHELDHP